MLHSKTQNSDGLTFDETEIFSKLPKKNPFADVPKTASGHFDLLFLAAAANLTRRLVQIFGTREAVFTEFPFLQIYDDRLAGREPDDLSEEKAESWWGKTVSDWEKSCETDLPFRDLRESLGFDFQEIILLVVIGLIEEDARFGLVFETLNEFSDSRRLTFGTLNIWQSAENRRIIREFQDAGLINFGETEKPRAEWTVRITTLLWDILRGERYFGRNLWFKLTDKEEAVSGENLILNENLIRDITLLPSLIKSGDVQAVMVRGANHNGRKTILGAIAHSLDLNLLEVNFADIKDDEQWKILCTLSILLKAMPIFRLDVAPSETVEFPAILASLRVFGATLGKQGGIGGNAIEKAVTLTVNLPDEKERSAHWKDFLKNQKSDEIDEITERFRLSSGNIRRAAALAKSYAALAKREKITLADVQQAARNLNRQALDTLAIYLEPLEADWSFLAIREETMSDLRQLEERCRIRENLRHHVGKNLRGQLQAGVRALFNGNSGTGKTYAARLLASSLQKDIYRLDLSTIVNKYIGETEKNLAKVFAFVEELDVILLLDEGDALLTQRTAVSSANDRYANLETNYLLQRLESFEGILIVTTNANDRIDSAFQRRMDTIVEFTVPTAAERIQIWDFHLPENNRISGDFLKETIQRCELTGGQIRNISLHAASLALSEKELLNTKHFETAVRREYRKMGAICPLRENFQANSAVDRW